MSRPRLRVPLDDLRAGERLLPDDAGRYVTRVHRRAPGDTLLCFDPAKALECEGRIVHVGREGCRVLLEAPRAAALRARRPVTLMQALGKGDKLDAIVRDASELGATRVVPLVTARTTVRSEGSSKRERWQRIAIEASRQCGRGDCLEVEPVTDLDEALARFAAPPPGLSLLLDPTAPRLAGTALSALPRDAALSFVVGPEGGFDDAEKERAEAAGYLRVGLGSFVLRTETVCAAMLGALLLGLGAEPFPEP